MHSSLMGCETIRELVEVLAGEIFLCRPLPEISAITLSKSLKALLCRVARTSLPVRLEATSWASLTAAR